MSWFRRHWIATILLILVMIISSAVFVSEPTESAPDSHGAGIFIFVLLALPILLVTWMLSRRRRRKSTPDTSQVAPIALTRPSSSSPTPVQRAVPENQTGDPSAFFETARTQIPQSQQRRGGNLALHDLLSMAPTEFEEFCGRALSGMGYKNMKRVGGAGDLQADLIGEDTHGRSTIVQCKRYKPGSKVGSPTIQTFIGMKNVHHGATRGIFVTTADYSRPAVKLAQQHDIVLLDGDDLVKIAGLVFIPRVTINPARKIRYCFSCGAELEDDGQFCKACGAQVRT